MSKKILIAEDEFEILKMFTDMLTVAGFSVEPAQDGEEALQKIAKENFDLILLDMQMPNKDGFAVLENLGRQGKISSQKVVILSNIDDEKWIRRAKELGAMDYWLKIDIHLTDLVEKIKKLLV